MEVLRRGIGGVEGIGGGRDWTYVERMERKYLKGREESKGYK